MMYLILLMINLIIVFLWDYFNWPQNLANQLAEIITNNKVHAVQLRKPFGCSLCTTIIFSLLYLFIFNELTLFNIVYYTLLAIINGYLTQFTLLIISTLDTFIEMILMNIQKFIDILKWK